MDKKIRPLRVIDSHSQKPASSKEIVSSMASDGTAALKARLKRLAQENRARMEDDYRVPDTIRVKTWTCKHCGFDTDGVDNYGYFKDPYTRKAVPCPECSPAVIAARARRQTDEKIKHLVRNLKLANMQNIPEEGALFTLGNYPAHADQIAKALVQNFVKGIIKELYLSGDPGRGKSGLAISAAKELANMGEQVLFLPMVTYIDLLNEDRDFNNQDKSHIEDIARLVDILILDDMGMERATETSVEKTGKLVNDRHAAGKRTLITSNFRIEDLNVCWRLAKYDGVFQPSIRIVSRLAGFYQEHKMTGTDLRRGY